MSIVGKYLQEAYNLKMMIALHIGCYRLYGQKVYMYILTLRRLLKEKLTKGQDAVIEVDKEGFAELLCHCFT